MDVAQLFKDCSHKLHLHIISINFLLVESTQNYNITLTFCDMYWAKDIWFASWMILFISQLTFFSYDSLIDDPVYSNWYSPLFMFIIERIWYLSTPYKYTISYVYFATLYYVYHVLLCTMFPLYLTLISFTRVKFSSLPRYRWFINVSIL